MHATSLCLIHFGTNRYICSYTIVAPSKTILDFRSKWPKTVSKTKMAQKPYQFLSKGLFTWSGGPRSSGVGIFCFHALEDTKQKKPTLLDRGPPLHVNRVLRIIIWIITRGFLIFPQFLNRSCSLCFTYWRSSMGHGHILLDFPYFLVLDFEKANFVWKQVSKPRCKLLVKNKQHKQLIDHTKPDDVHFLVSNSSFLLPFWFIRRHFNQKFNHFSLSSSLKPAPGMSPGIRSTWSPPVLVISNLPQGPKAYFQATSGFFFLTCDQHVSFFLNPKIIEFLRFLGLHFRWKRLSCKSQACKRTVMFVGKLPRIRRSRNQSVKY